jgi:predicted ester cyclase
MSTIEQNKQLARRVPEEIATQGNLDLIEEVFAEDAIEHGVFDDARGHDAIRASLEGFRLGFSDFSATVEDMVCEGDTVAMRVTIRGTHDSPFMGFEPTGNEVEVQNMVFTRVENGKIVERWIQPDTLGLLRQLGVISSETVSMERPDSKKSR